MSAQRTLYRFGPYEFDVGAAILRKGGSRIRLQRKPLLALEILLRRPGALVTREELCRSLWDADTYVAFDDSLNHAVKRLRDALNDSPEHPRYIETIPGRGYRFAASVQQAEYAHQDALVSREKTSASPYSPTNRISLLIAAALVPLLFVAFLLIAARSPSEDGIEAGAKPVIAVLPLADLSQDQENAYFARAMTEELISRLARVSGLQVISRTSAERIASDSTQSLPEIADQLGATHIVEGSVSRTGNRLRIIAQLIDADADSHLWTGTYTREIGDVIELQNQVALEIVREIHVELSPSEEASLTESLSVRPEVYSAYIDARSLVEGGHMSEAIKAFQHVIDLDPQFAPAYSWLADSYIAYNWWRGPPVDLLPTAKRVAQRALQLDDSLADAHLLMGKLEAFYEHEWESAERHYRRAIEVRPSYPKAYLGYGVYLAVQGRRDEAVQMARQAVALDPMSSSTLGSAGDIYYFTDFGDEAISHFRRAADLHPEGSMWHAMLGCAYTEAGDFERGIESIQRSLPLAADDARPKAILAWANAQAGRDSEAQRLVAELDQQAGDGNATYYFRSMGYLATGDLDRTFELLNHAVDQRWAFVATVAVIPPFDAIRDDPRYAKLMARLRLENTLPPMSD